MHAHGHTSVLVVLLLLVIVLLLLLLLLLSEGKRRLSWLAYIDAWHEDGHSSYPLSETLLYSVQHCLGFLGRNQPPSEAVNLVVVDALLIHFCLVVLCEAP